MKISSMNREVRILIKIAQNTPHTTVSISSALVRAFAMGMFHERICGDSINYYHKLADTIDAEGIEE